MSGTHQALAAHGGSGSTDDNHGLDDGIYVVEDGELTQVADDEGGSQPDDRTLQAALERFGVNGRVYPDFQSSIPEIRTNPRRQVVLNTGGRRTRTGPLPRKAANAIVNALFHVDGVSAEQEGFWAENADGHTTD